MALRHLTTDARDFDILADAILTSVSGKPLQYNTPIISQHLEDLLSDWRTHRLYANRMARIIWDKPGNPTKYVSDKLGITRQQLGVAIHELKAAGNLSPAERVIIYDDRMVTDEHGDVLGNIYNEI